MKVYWSAKAKARLKEIHDFISHESRVRADAVLDRLIRRSSTLADFPHIGRKVPEYDQEDLREVLERPFRIIYRVRPDRIDVLTVKHFRQRLPSRRRNL